MAEPSTGVPAAERTLALLEVLVAGENGVSSAELLEAVGGSRSGLYALINTLRDRGYLVTEDGRHRPGPAAWRLVPARPRELEMLLAAFRNEPPHLDESVALAWPQPTATTIVAEVQADQPVRVVYRPGSIRPPSSPDAVVISAGEAGDSIELRRVRRDARAIVRSDDMVEVAVPVVADGVRPIAALVAGIPAQRATAEREASIERSLRQFAARLSHRLGAPVYQPYGWAPSAPLGPSRELTAEELDEFLSGLWGAQLACVRKDGTPHVVPLWYEWDGEAMWLAASPGASWATYIRDNPHVSVTLDEPWSPLRRVFLTGVAEEVEEAEVPGGLDGLRRRLAIRYLGQGAEDQSELSDVEGWTAVRIAPSRIVGKQGLGPMTEDAS